MPTLNVLSSITLNLLRPNTNVVVYAKQYDMISRVIDINLVAGNQVWDPPSGCEMVVMYSKPDGTCGVYDVADDYEAFSSLKTYDVGDRVIRNNIIYRCETAVTVPGPWVSSNWSVIAPVTPGVVKTGTGKLRLTLAQQALTANGNVYVQVAFFNDTERLTTLSFIVAVEQTAPSDTQLKSSDYFNILSVLIEGLIGAAAHPPQINPITLNWMTWNETTAQYEDSGYSAVGATGPAPTIVTNVVEYVASNSGTVIPTTGWETTIPEVSPGYWLWTRITLTYDTGDVVRSYSKAYQGQDGQGSPGSQNPLGMSSAAVVGVATAYSREDHQHPFPIGYSNETLVFPRYD